MKETTAKINKRKSWIFGKINKINKPLTRFIKKEKRGRRIKFLIKLEMKKEVTIDNTAIQRLIGDSHEQLEPIKWNLE